MKRLAYAFVAMAIACGSDVEPRTSTSATSSGSGGGTGGAECAAQAGDVCVASTAYGPIYLEQATEPDGYAIIGFEEPDACTYFLEVENVLEEQGTPVSFLKVELFGQLPGTCAVTGNPEPAAPDDGSCLAVVRTTRFSAAGEEDVMASGGEVIVTRLDEGTLEATVETTLAGRAVSLTLAAPHCPLLCTCTANLPDCPC